ncbi:GTP pyrophosphokinase family protein [Paenibacillus sp. 7124]|uniref:GTP pyrophosphokinase family protein n=2 Tax=Paenibacillus apii TaxID=1850370 RepID=A0A6M1PQL5_9BACL|nr:GTP pyrophosphokinase family protein [Paenibacillus apii]NJJ38355.1 GTP pyrophosphokinase family protein [Paenibacillus apii]
MLTLDQLQVHVQDLGRLELNEDLSRQLGEFKKMPALYRLALKELENKVETLKTEWKMRDGYSPIEHIKSRVKEPKSILQKLERKGYALSFENIETHIHDIAGMRIVCAFVKDIYRLADHFNAREDIRVLEIKDYIDQPKPNGYQSLHVIVAVPLILLDGTKWVKAEIQLRTLAMDFWASMEHILYYKYDKQLPAHVADELKSAARAADELDKKMLRLRREILDLS